MENSTMIKASDYTKYPRRFITYRWFKPLLVFLITAAFYVLFSVLIVFAGMAADTAMGTNVIDSLMGGYDSFDSYSAIGSMVNLGGVACMLLALIIGAEIVGDRPFSSYASSRGGWSFKIFFACTAVCLVICALPNVIMAVFIDGRTDASRFTIAGFILCTILGPLQCIAEEYIFRGFLMQTFGSWTRVPLIAIILQSLAFAALHPYNSLGVILILFDGICFGLIAWYTKGLEATSALHIVNNMSAFYLSGFGYGAISSEVDYTSFIWAAVINVVYIIFIIVVRKKSGWFDRVKRDDVAEFNAKAQELIDRKAARKAARAARKAAKNGAPAPEMSAAAPSTAPEMPAAASAAAVPAAAEPIAEPAPEETEV